MNRAWLKLTIGVYLSIFATVGFGFSVIAVVGVAVGWIQTSFFTWLLFALLGIPVNAYIAYRAGRYSYRVFKQRRETNQ